MSSHVLGAHINELSLTKHTKVHIIMSEILQPVPLDSHFYTKIKQIYGVLLICGYLTLIPPYEELIIKVFLLYQTHFAHCAEFSIRQDCDESQCPLPLILYRKEFYMCLHIMAWNGSSLLSVYIKFHYFIYFVRIHTNLPLFCPLLRSLYMGQFM